MLYKNTTGTGADLVLLHGWGFNSRMFNELVERYSHKYRITTIDIPGHGKSADVDGSLDDWSSEIIKIMPNNPILLGWSLGGLLAINIASKVSISKLILVASSPNFVNDKNWEFGIDRNNFFNFSNSLNLDLSKGLKRFVSLQSTDKAQIKNLNIAIDKYPATKKALDQGLQILLNTDLTCKLKKINIPIKVMLGRRDALVPLKINNWYQKNNIQTQVLNAAHLPFLCKEFKL